MANSAALVGSVSQAHSLRSVWKLRLTLGFTILSGTLITLFGTAWDIQWHTYVGRDRTLIPPHLMMLGGIALSGLVALLAVVTETLWAQHSPEVAKAGTRFVERFHAPLGAYIAGFAALDAAIAFPLDQYWHALYGIDVAIWAPFHIMILVSVTLTALGATYMLFSAARLAAQSDALVARRVGYLGVVVGFATTLSHLTLLLPDALGNQNFRMVIGFIPFNLFLPLSGLASAWILVAATSVIPWRATATFVTGIYLAIALLFTAFVPPMMSWLVASEQLSYRRNLGMAAYFSVVMLRWPLVIIAGAVLIDIFTALARKRHWPRITLFAALAAAALLGSIPFAVSVPDISLQMAARLGITGMLVSILLGAMGAIAGVWLGQRTSTSIQQEGNP
jgi:hypothetical protein